MADEQAPAAPVKAPAPVARAAHWQQALGVNDAEHEAALIAGGIRVNVDVTRTKYQSALARWRKGPA